MNLSRGFFFLFSTPILLLLALSTACSSKWERKLGEKELEALLSELYTTQALLDGVSPRANDTIRLAAQNAIFEKYKVTPAEFDSIIAYYGHYRANRLSVIMGRASENLMMERESFLRRVGIDKDYLANLFRDDYTFGEIAGIIPKNYFPRYVRLSSEGDSEVFTGLINDTIPKAGRFVVHLKVRGLPLDTATRSLETYPKLIASYSTEKGLRMQREILITGGKEHTLSLFFKEKTPPGRVTIALYLPLRKLPITLFVESLGIANSPLSTVECHVFQEEGKDRV